MTPEFIVICHRLAKDEEALFRFLEAAERLADAINPKDAINPQDFDKGLLLEFWYSFHRIQSLRKG